VIKTDGPIAARAARYGSLAAAFGAVLFVGAGVWIATGIHGFRVDSAIDTALASNPLHKVVSTAPGAWMDNYRAMPWTMAAPLLGVLGALASAALLRLRRGGLAFIASGTSIAAVILTVGLAIFPFLLPSSSMPAAGLTLWDASSSRLTLWIMLLATIVFLPLVLAYTSWVYRVLRGKVTDDSVADTPNAY